MLKHNEIANDVVNAVKEYILLQKKHEPNKHFYNADISYYNCVSGGKSGIIININYNDVTNILDKYDFIYVIKEVKELLTKLKKEKGWDGIDFEEKEIYLPNSLKTISVPYVSMYSEPCKEFTKLAKFLEKHCGKIITHKDIYQVCIGGKRGRIYGEDGCRNYLCYNPTRCEKLLEELRETKKTRDIASASDVKSVDDIDDFELQVSIRHETEFNGLRYTELIVKVETPNGKTKKIINICL